MYYNKTETNAVRSAKWFKRKRLAVILIKRENGGNYRGKNSLRPNRFNVAAFFMCYVWSQK